MTATAVPREGRHRSSGHVLPQPPSNAEKGSYAWRSLPLLATALSISALCLIVAQVWFEVSYASVLPFAIAIFAAYTAAYCVYQLVSLPVNFAGRGFDLTAHKSLIEAWRPRRYPSVDIFLPICGEPIEVLHNTWIGVFELVQAYPGSAYVYVLDDGPSEQARAQAPSFGFTYVQRPTIRQHKKAGNLNYAFRRTAGEHIVIFDADFRPRADFLA
jgi:cellulose synthase (UDP-forming)